MAINRIKVTGKDAAWMTQVVDAETGEPIHCVHRIEIIMDANTREYEAKLSIHGQYIELDIDNMPATLEEQALCEKGLARVAQLEHRLTTDEAFKAQFQKGFDQVANGQTVTFSEDGWQA